MARASRETMKRVGGEESGRCVFSFPLFFSLDTFLFSLVYTRGLWPVCCQPGLDNLKRSQMTGDAPPSKPTASAASPSAGGAGNPFASAPPAAAAAAPAHPPPQPPAQAPVTGVPVSGASAYAFGPGGDPPPPQHPPPPPVPPPQGGWQQHPPGGGVGWGGPLPPPGPVPFDGTAAYQQPGSLAPLPFGGIGYQLPLFLFGWLFAPLWFVGAALPACGRRDPRERCAWSLNVCMSVAALVVAAWAVTAAGRGRLYHRRW